MDLERDLGTIKDCSGIRNKNIGLGQGFKVGRTQYQEQEQ